MVAAAAAGMLKMALLAVLAVEVVVLAQQQQAALEHKVTQVVQMKQYPHTVLVAAAGQVK
jgi:hypothetical protein